MSPLFVTEEERPPHLFRQWSHTRLQVEAKDLDISKTDRFQRRFHSSWRMAFLVKRDIIAVPAAISIAEDGGIEGGNAPAWAVGIFHHTDMVIFNDSEMRAAPFIQIAGLGVQVAEKQSACS